MLIRSQPKRYLDNRQARKYWLASFRKIKYIYTAPGDPHLANRVQNLLAPIDVRLDERWGLNHGIWSVLRRVFPKADVTVVQLTIYETQPPEFHSGLGKGLSIA